MEVTTRRATAQDHDLIIATRLEFLAEVRGPGYEFPTDFEATTRTFIETEFAHGRLHTWIAESDGEVLGAISMLLWPRPPQPEDSRVTEAYIINMYVVPTHQRRGIGKQLLGSCLASTDQFGIRKFLLHSTEAGRGLYESAGFRPKSNWMELPT